MPKIRKTRKNQQPKKNGRTSKRSGLPPRLPKMSYQGLNFLKCAFAPPDFAMDPGMGIPDQYDGKTLMKKDQLSSSISMTAGTDIFIMTIPVPGVSYYSCSVASGTFPTSTTTWTPTYYQGYQSGGLFGAGSNYWSGDNVTAFRYASSCCGVYPTSSVMNSSGAIQVWKAPIKLVIGGRSGTAPYTLQYTAVGMESVQAVGPENFTTKFLDGCYSVSTCNQPDFPFQPLISNFTGLPTSSVTSAEVDQYGYLQGAIGGIGHMDTTIIRLTAPASSINSFVLKTWNCIEYQVEPTSSLYLYASPSAPFDPIAIAYYHKVKKELPLAVIAAMNATFWERVKDVLRTVSKGLSYIPGPVGLISQGVNQLLTS